MMKPTKTAEELRNEILDAAGADREDVGVTINRRSNGTWDALVTGTPLPELVRDLAADKIRELQAKFDLAP